MEPGIGLDRVDHLIVARPDLATGVDEIERLCGVRPAIGGRHPDWGSHNALLSLGPRTYLEVIAPDPESAVPPEKRPSVFTRPGTNLVNGWIANQSNIAGALALLSDHGCRMGTPVHGRRALPDGRVLSWTLTDPSVTLFDGVMPILIDWGDSPHPGGGSPPGCSLESLRLGHPRADELAGLLELLEIRIPVEHSAEPFIRAGIDGPSGSVELS